MRYRIEGAGWPIEGTLIPCGTILDFARPDHCTALAAGKIPPPNTMPLDEEAGQLMLKHYPAVFRRFFGITG